MPSPSIDKGVGKGIDKGSVLNKGSSKGLDKGSGLEQGVGKGLDTGEIDVVDEQPCPEHLLPAVSRNRNYFTVGISSDVTSAVRRATEQHANS